MFTIVKIKTLPLTAVEWLVGGPGSLVGYRSGFPLLL